MGKRGMTRAALAALNHGVGAVIVDALEIFGFDAVPVNVGVGVAPQGDGADEVFDKNGVVVGAFGHVFFIGSFQEGEDFGAGARFDEGDEILDPNGFAEGDFEADEAALIVGAALADGFTAWAEGGDGNGDGDFEAEIFSMEGGVEVDLIVDEAGGGGDGRFFFDEVRKVEFEVGGVGLEALLESAEDGGDAFDMNEAAVFLENFEEAAHVGAFELVGEIDGEGDGGDGVLGRVGAVADEDGVAETFDADLIDPEISGIGRGLGVLKGLSLGRGLFQRRFILSESEAQATDLRPQIRKIASQSVDGKRLI